MSTFDGYFREFNGLVRADRFDSSPPSFPLTPSPLIHLLSHAHSDHLVGLESFSATPVYCSAVTKDLVLKLSRCGMRMRKEVEGAIARDRGIRTYEKLSWIDTDSRGNKKKRSTLQALPVGSPVDLQLPNAAKDVLRLTLIDANHCPGSVMFLCQMWGQSILYTGDVRAEAWWVESLCKMPAVAPLLGRYTAKTVKDVKGKGKAKANDDDDEDQEMEGVYTPLDNIYLDTSSFMCRAVMPSKSEGIDAIIKIMESYPDDTVFFLNAWTWGYEELIERVALHFNTKIHVDSYKSSIFSSPSFRLHHPLLSRLCTSSLSTRFHACERKYRCRITWGPSGTGCYDYSGVDGCEELVQKTDEWERECVREGRRVVSVNPWDMERERWDAYKKDTEEKLKIAKESGYDGPVGGNGDPWPDWLVCPLARHSSYPELHHLVSIFRPVTLYPNTIYAGLDHLDYRLMPVLFADVLHSPASVAQLAKEAWESERRSKHKKNGGGMVKDDLFLPTDGKYSNELIAKLRNDPSLLTSAVDKHLDEVPDFAEFMWQDNWVGGAKTKEEAQGMMFTSPVGFSKGFVDEGRRSGERYTRKRIELAPELPYAQTKTLDELWEQQAAGGLELLPNVKVDFSLGVVKPHPTNRGEKLLVTDSLLSAAARHKLVVGTIYNRLKAGDITSPTEKQCRAAYKPLTTLTSLKIDYTKYARGGEVTEEEVEEKRRELARMGERVEDAYALEREWFAKHGGTVKAKVEGKGTTSSALDDPDELQILPGPPTKATPKTSTKSKKGGAGSSSSRQPTSSATVIPMQSTAATSHVAQPAPAPTPSSSSRPKTKVSPAQLAAQKRRETPNFDLVPDSQSQVVDRPMQSTAAVAKGPMPVPTATPNVARSPTRTSKRKHVDVDAGSSSPAAPAPMQSTARNGAAVAVPSPAPSSDESPPPQKRAKPTLSSTFDEAETARGDRQFWCDELAKCFHPTIRERMQAMPSAADRVAAHERVDTRMRECTVKIARATRSVWRCERSIKTAVTIRINSGAKILRERNAQEA